MTAATILTMANGCGIDLLNVRVEDIHFPTLAEHLAKEKRYNGATPGVEYSVAQHCCIGTAAILRSGGTDEEAGYFHLHDCHEALLKDDTTPKKQAIAAVAEREFGVLHSSILKSFDMLTDRIDGAVHQAAGLPWPMPFETQRIVKIMDLRLFVTEWRDLMHGAAHPNWAPYAGLQPLEQTIEPWPWSVARDLWLDWAIGLLPGLRRAQV